MNIVDRFIYKYSEQLKLTMKAMMNGKLSETYRGGGLGLAKDNQVRGQAWAMRALGETYRSLPDNHPRKSYFGGRLATNLDWYAKQYPL